jgi:hypothetical protein
MQTDGSVHGHLRNGRSAVERKAAWEYSGAPMLVWQHRTFLGRPSMKIIKHDDELFAHRRSCYCPMLWHTVL